MRLLWLSCTGWYIGHWWRHLPMLVVSFLPCPVGGSVVLSLPPGAACGVLASFQCSDWRVAGPTGNLTSLYGCRNARPVEAKCLVASLAGVQAALRHRVNRPWTHTHTDTHTGCSNLVLSLFWVWLYVSCRADLMSAKEILSGNGECL